MQPSFNKGGELVMSRVLLGPPGSRLPIGEPVDVTIELPYADKLGWELSPGMEFQLNVGARAIGTGTVMARE